MRQIGKRGRMKVWQTKMEEVYVRGQHRHIIEKQILPTIATETLLLKEWYYKKSHDLQLSETNSRSSGWKTIRVGEEWGGDRQDVWFHKRVRLPGHFIGKQLLLQLIPGGEGLVYLNGREYCGIDLNHTDIFVTGTETLDILLGMHSGWSNRRWSAPHGWHGGIQRFSQAVLSLFQVDAYRLYHYLRNLNELLFDVRTKVSTVTFLKEVFDETVRRLALQHPGFADYYQSISGALRYMERNLFTHGVKADLGQPYLIGHSHLDVIYLWPLSQSVHKASRTFSSMLSLMDRYPAFRFTQSSAIFYKFMKDRFPRIYRSIKKHIASGQWEMTGGMWLESDCHIPSGESLVRQFLYGQRFFRKEFGCYCNIGWLPDVFGFNANLPQIMARAGIRYFITAKLADNLQSPFPHRCFRWRAPDGSTVIAVSLPYGYGGIASPAKIQAASDCFRQQQLSGPAPIMYGFSDGGGGVTDAMIQSITILSKMLPKGQIRFSTAEMFFRQLERITRLKTWNDELYYERHQGTFTTEARTKRGNRRCEQGLRQAEIMSVMAWLNGSRYPRDVLEQCWKKVLQNQFHDAVTGTCVIEATNQIMDDYAKVLSACDAMTCQSVQHILAQQPKRHANAKYLAVFNLSSDRTSGLVSCPVRTNIHALRDFGGSIIPVQLSADGRELMFAANDLPQMGYKVYTVESSGRFDPPKTNLKATRTGRVENEFYAARFNRAGELIDLFFKPSRARLIDAHRPANQFQFFEDIDKHYDAWDIMRDYEKKRLPQPVTTSFRLAEAGPLRVIYSIEKRFQSSVIRQRICCYAHTARIDFKTEVDWREKHVLWKTAFPVHIKASVAVCEIPYATLARSIQPKTLYERTKFEVPAQRWVDVSGPTCGVSLLNDCKYGYDLKHQVMRLTLLRAPTMPNPQADQGRHEFTYSLFCHASDWRRGKTFSEARELNEPVKTFQTDRGPGAFSLAASAHPNVIIETVKFSEDHKDVILRIFEAYGKKTKASIRVGFRVAAAFETNLLEDIIKAACLRDQHLIFTIQPFEIRTFRLIRSQKTLRRNAHGDKIENVL